MLDSDFTPIWSAVMTVTMLLEGAWVYGTRVWQQGPLLRWSGALAGAAFILVASSLVVNALAPQPPSEGAKVYVCGITVLVAALSFVLARFRHR